MLRSLTLAMESSACGMRSRIFGFEVGGVSKGDDVPGAVAVVIDDGQRSVRPSGDFLRVASEADVHEGAAEHAMGDQGDVTAVAGGGPPLRAREVARAVAGDRPRMRRGHRESQRSSSE